MKTTFIKTAILIQALLFMACDKSGSDGFGSSNTAYTPYFSNNWIITKPVSNVPPHYNFTVSSVDSSKGTGILDAAERNDAGTYTYNVTGSYNKLTVTLRYKTKAENNNTYNGPRSDSTYSGRYDTIKPYRIRLLNTRNSKDSLVLQLQ